jgi:hypothetical protein
MKQVLDLHSLAAVELPDRHVMSPVVLVVVDVQGNTINVLSFNDIAAAVNACGQQFGGNVLSIDVQTQRVVCQAQAR